LRESYVKFWLIFLFLDVDEISDINLCKICMESMTDCVLLECGHMVTCTNCGKRLNECKSKSYLIQFYLLIIYLSF
jgi:hypothetical protein